MTGALTRALRGGDTQSPHGPAPGGMKAQAGGGTQMASEPRRRGKGLEKTLPRNLGRSRPANTLLGFQPEPGQVCYSSCPACGLARTAQNTQAPPASRLSCHICPANREQSVHPLECGPGQAAFHRPPSTRPSVHPLVHLSVQPTHQSPAGHPDTSASPHPTRSPSLWAGLTPTL